MEKENQLQIFNNDEFGQVKVIKDEKGEPLFELYSTGMALGYSRVVNSKGKEYLQARKDRIDKVMENGYITGLYRDGQTYLTEDMLYDFIFEAKTEKSRPFRKWVTNDVLPELRKTGTYSLDGKQQNNELVMIGNNILEQVTTSLSKFEDKINNRFDKLEEKQEELEEYYKPTHKKKLGINGFIKSCLGENSTKENVGRATEQLLFLLGDYGTYQEVPKDVLEDSKTKSLVYDICKNINLSINRGIEIK
jgi:prophage antirepressor-like protein